MSEMHCGSTQQEEVVCFLSSKQVITAIIGMWDSNCPQQITTIQKGANSYCNIFTWHDHFHWATGAIICKYQSRHKTERELTSKNVAEKIINFLSNQILNCSCTYITFGIRLINKVMILNSWYILRIAKHHLHKIIN